MSITPATDQRKLRRPETEMLRHIRSLALGEAFNVVMQPLLFFGWIGLPTTINNLAGLALVLFFLIQGSFYWVSKYQQIRKRLPAPAGIPIFRTLRWVNIALLILGFILIAPAALSDPTLDHWPGLAFWAFAVLEYVNYFHVQLMPTRPYSTWRPRTSRLARDLKAQAQSKKHTRS